MEYIRSLDSFFEWYLVYLVACLTYYWVRVRLIDKEPAYFRPRIRKYARRIWSKLNER